eukprot:symbB.v1.2.009712.t1/scaffold610.1/size181618/7
MDCLTKNPALRISVSHLCIGHLARSFIQKTTVRPLTKVEGIMEGDHFNDLARSLTRTEYQRIGNTHSFAGETPAWHFTGKPWTQAETLRSREVRQGCGITPRIYPAPIGTINEEFRHSET